MSMHILQAGPLTTVQDRGRFGYMEYGITSSGVMDTLAYSQLVSLLENEPGAAVLEMTLMGAELVFDEEGNLHFRTDADEGDLLYDEIGSILKIKQIQKDLDDGIDTIGKKMTVCQLYEKYTRQRGNVRKGTQKSRQQLMKLLSEDKLGAASIDSVKLSDAKEWAIRMKEKGISYKTISNDKRSLKAAFYTAIQDDCIRKNPFDFQLNTVCLLYTSPSPRDTR